MPRLILASQSPRRRELLEQIGLTFDVIPADINESVQAGELAVDFVARMAREKAEAVARQQPDALVLGSDTAVVVDEHILGKPADKADARRMLGLLSGREHAVLSAVALIVPGQAERVITQVSRVRFRSISETEMHAYWRSGEPKDKAGAYAIQGLGAVFVEHLSGSYSGVMGLPLFETARLLEEAGISSL
ncbi:Maf family protein [Natronospira bacteriovora]|uniref:dTTP/UTP pyrophosphatase n=1 Tax=Natronospira bacteriovora TaxID=3069753 RepID=A0ABU0WAI9_9GAMM|nr:Maf family protein [Natronospira sp. AB-CW4]MDQ2069960.1 Maf family protein [Natronospira sp. AB-CW4]